MASFRIKLVLVGYECIRVQLLTKKIISNIGFRGSALANIKIATFNFLFQASKKYVSYCNSVGPSVLEVLDLIFPKVAGPLISSVNRNLQKKNIKK
jgi:hypothetical protein